MLEKNYLTLYFHVKTEVIERVYGRWEPGIAMGRIP